MGFSKICLIFAPPMFKGYRFVSVRLLLCSVERRGRNLAFRTTK